MLARGSVAAHLQSPMHASIVIVLITNALKRIAGAASGALIGLYLASLANQGQSVTAVLVGTLGSISFFSELLLVLPLGILSDATAPRILMVGGSLLGALATQLFGLSSHIPIFFLSRAIEGAAVAASTPSILAHLTEVTERDAILRGRVMSYFELTLLVGIALGGVLGGTLFREFSTTAFSLVAIVYLLCAFLFWLGTRLKSTNAEKRRFSLEALRGLHSNHHAIKGFLQVIRDPRILILAPAWIAINAIAGTWLGPTPTFLFTLQDTYGQHLTGLFAAQPQRVGYVMLMYASAFGIGILIWSALMARFTRKQIMNITLASLLMDCMLLVILNHSNDFSSALRWALIVVILLLLMVASGFTPTALALLADATHGLEARGSAMALYTVLLTIGNIVGNFLAGVFANWLAFDGIISSTVLLGLIALVAIRRLH
jgi:MFS family permease